MRKLDITKYFWDRINQEDYNSKIVECIFNDTFSFLPDNEKREYLVELFNGLMKYDVSIEYICDIYKELMKFDNYNRDNVKSVRIDNSVVLECTGSGKKPIKTLNISTPSIITAVSAGAKIIKKGSGATSSVIGSADLIYGLGYNKNISEVESESLLRDSGFTFVDIEHMIPNFNSIYSGNFYSPHILSYVLAAQVTSLRGDKIIYGLADANVNRSCDALKYMNKKSKISVYTSVDSEGYCFDELIGNGNGLICRYADECTWDSEIKLDLPTASKVLAKNSREESIQAVVSLLKNHSNEDYLHIVAYNAGFYLFEAEIVESISDGISLAEECIRSNKAYTKLIEIIELSGGTPSWY